MNSSRLSAYPGPGHYTTKSSIADYTGKTKEEGKFVQGSKQEKICAFIEEARFMGKATPPANYEVKFVNKIHNKFYSLRP